MSKIIDTNNGEVLFEFENATVVDGKIIFNDKNENEIFTFTIKETPDSPSHKNLKVVFD